MKNGSGNTIKTRRLTKEEIKKQFIDSLINSEKVEIEDLNKQADEVEKSDEAAIIIKVYKDIIRTKKKTQFL